MLLVYQSKQAHDSARVGELAILHTTIGKKAPKHQERWCTSSTAHYNRPEGIEASRINRAQHSTRRAARSLNRPINPRRSVRSGQIDGPISVSRHCQSPPQTMKPLITPPSHRSTNRPNHPKRYQVHTAQHSRDWHRRVPHNTLTRSCLLYTSPSPRD